MSRRLAAFFSWWRVCTDGFADVRIYRLDEAGSREMTSYSSHTSGAFEEEHMWSFPCTCAGSPVPKKQGKPTALEKRASPCGGTIGLHVGDDFALEAYGIKGQSIRLEVNHHYRAGASGGSRA